MKLVSKIALGATAVMGSMAASANEDVTTALTTAISTGQTNYTLVVVGLLSLAAIGFGVGFIVSKLSR
ncbi:MULTISPECIES: hypothetical protein [Pseudoalteromonas]|uniref:Major coat protein n=1 Tax=Pseudoalteromonas piscicida TaxID=43662 RepID=A0ABN5CNI4_PSEO7|nr:MULTISPECIES: hypothetical protein [Pseudoalteromonas]ATD10253.1 hypothetical protein PPIS_b1249 [Pseudoalteromonas piscicida]WPU32092.1 hypothetical protein SIO17_24115 [Pseudoalteromonas piscicida]